MSVSAIIVFAALAAGVLIVAFSMYTILKNTKLHEQIKEQQNKLTALEARLAERDLLAVAAQKSKSARENSLKKPVVKSAQEEVQSQEMLALRKENAHLKDDVKELRERVREREVEVKQVEESVEKRLFHLQTENRHFVEMLREQEGKIKAKVEFPEAKELETARQELSQLRQRSGELEGRLKSEMQRKDEAVERLGRAQNELRKWRDTMTLVNGKTLDPELFARWFSRANEGRRMYQLMRQVRELSDIKLATYQDGVLAISGYILSQLGIEKPLIAPGEVASDRYLAVAWSAISKGDQSISSVAYESESAETSAPVNSLT